MSEPGRMGETCEAWDQRYHVVATLPVVAGGTVNTAGGKLIYVTVVNRADLAAFLRARRARLSPKDAGLPEVGRRRTPGLRRQEVAQLAGLSVDYYIRLEQGRGPNPSRQVLSALARALMLTADERDYLFRMTGHNPPQTAPPSREITPGIRHLLDSMPTTPAYVVDAAYNVLAWNQLATHFIGNLAAYRDRNMIRWTFRRSPEDTVWDDEHYVRFTRATVADLRSNYARYPGDPEIEGLVTEMLALSPRFADMWATQEVETRAPMLKHIHHPEAGPLDFECQVLHIAETGQRLITYCAAPGSATAEAFTRLATDPVSSTPSS
jgi:transcriptional regulator with XRE-family HTH domain